MAKFKISLKLTGLELQVEGSRDDVPLMTEAVGRQFAGLLMPASDIVEGEIVSPTTSALPAPIEQRTTRKSPRRRSQTGHSSAKPATTEAALDWRHDSSKWGTPQQGWATADKSIWLLYVVANELSVKEMTGRQISSTFNKHFRQAGPIQVFNVNRDLGKLKLKSPALTSEDTTKDPSAWFLVHAGEQRAQELVTKALGQTKTTDTTSSG